MEIFAYILLVVSLLVDACLVVSIIESKRRLSKIGKLTRYVEELNEKLLQGLTNDRP